MVQGKKLRLLGQRFGRWMVLSESDKKHKNRYTLWNCQCDCGNKKVVAGFSLRLGHTKSCGCLRFSNDESKKNRVIHEIYWEYKYNAKKRERSFNLTKSQFIKLIDQSCHYCKKEKSNTRIFNHARGIFTFNYNGIDRIDSNLGYDIHNSVPCCELCNWMKRDLSLSEFNEHINLLAKELQNVRD